MASHLSPLPYFLASLVFSSYTLLLTDTHTLHAISWLHIPFPSRSVISVNHDLMTRDISLCSPLLHHAPDYQLDLWSG